MLRLRNDKNEAQVNYLHNFRPSVGVGAMIVGINFLASVKLPASLIRDPQKYGEPDMNSFHLNINAKSIVAGFDYQYLNGFYLHNTQNLPASPSSGPPLLPELSVERINFNTTYVFRSEKFSYRSVITHADRQLKSAGSFLLNLDLNYFKLSGNGNLVPENLRENFQSPLRLEKAKFRGVALMPGYSYTLVYNGFYFNLGLAAGPNLWYSNYVAGSEAENKWQLKGKADFRGGVGYDGGKYFSGIYVLLSRNLYRAGGLDITNDSSLFRFSLGCRFQDTGWMQSIRNWSLYRRAKNTFK